MPILAAEPDIYPGDLWTRLDKPDEDERRWWCLHTRPRQEKSAARDLRSRRLAHYLPQSLRVSRTPAGRVTRSVIPLFPGYLFLYGSEVDRVEAVKGNHLANVLEVVDQAGLLADLRQVQRLVASGCPVSPVHTHPIGTRVRVVSGPLEGLQGTVVRRFNEQSDRFVAVVRMLGRGASVEMKDWQVELVSDVAVNPPARRWPSAVDARPGPPAASW